MYRCIKNSYVSAQKILVTKENKLIGINLGYDFIKEHEKGIAPLRKFFDINEFELGIKGYEIQQKNLKENLLIKKLIINKQKYICLILKTNEKIKDINFKNLSCEDLYPLESIIGIKEDILYENLYTAWDESSFGILADEKYENYLYDLYNAFIKGDICLDIHTDNFFPNKGLTISIKSRIPQNIFYELYKKDSSSFKLICKVCKLGIADMLRKNKKEYLDLTPSWKDNTEKEIIFYLNPKNQNLYKTGWFEMKDLYDWVEDKGKILR